MSILVTGSAGYIGSHTVYELVARGEKVIIIDNLTTGNIKAVHPKAKFYQGDIRNKDFINIIIYFQMKTLILSYILRLIH